MSRAVRRLLVGLRILCFLFAFLALSSQVGIFSEINGVGFHDIYAEWTLLEDQRKRDQGLPGREAIDISVVAQNTREVGPRMAAEYVASRFFLFCVVFTFLGVALWVFTACTAQSDAAGKPRAVDDGSPSAPDRRFSTRSSLLAVLGVLFILSALFALAGQRSAEMTIHRGYDRAYREWIRLSMEAPLQEEPIDAQYELSEPHWTSAHSANSTRVVESTKRAYRVISVFFAIPGVTLLLVSVRAHFHSASPR